MLPENPELCLIALGDLGVLITTPRSCSGPLQPTGLEKVSKEARVTLSGGCKCQMAGQVLQLT